MPTRPGKNSSFIYSNGRLGPIHGSPGQAPVLSPIPRRDSIEVRGRSTSASGNGEHGLERVIESLKYENGEYKKMVRELDDRCISPSSPPYSTYPCIGAKNRSL